MSWKSIRIERFIVGHRRVQQAGYLRHGKTDWCLSKVLLTQTQDEAQNTLVGAGLKRPGVGIDATVLRYEVIRII